MSVNPGGQHRSDAGTGLDGVQELTADAMQGVARAYLATYRGPHGDAPGAESAVTGPVDGRGQAVVAGPA
jgi:glutamate dehydrogenase